ncbi:MAG: hypothetical protein RL538_252 [Candidatus Parcubacteria bacterium]|jgi:hypothetical protein
MGIEAQRFDEHLERIITREQAVRHLSKTLEVGDSFNPSSLEAEIHEDPELSTDVVIFFRSDDGKYATTQEPYSLFLSRYNLADGTIPDYKFRIEEWSPGIPCLKVRITE